MKKPAMQKNMKSAQPDGSETLGRDANMDERRIESSSSLNSMQDVKSERDRPRPSQWHQLSRVYLKRFILLLHAA